MMNQAQQMNESLGQTSEIKGLGKFVGKLEEIENDLSSAALGFGAVGKAVAKAQTVSRKEVQANVDRAVKMMRDAEKIVQGIRISLSGQAGEALGESEAVGKLKLKPGDKVKVSDHRMGTRTGTATGVIGKNVSGKVWSIDL